MNGRVLIVAGSDSGGGAGIQADIKTVTMLGGYAATAVTSLAAQNTRGVLASLAVAPAFVQQQMRVVLEDLGADAVKTGVLPDAASIDAVCDVLEAEGAGRPVVVDPVIVSKSGQRVLDTDGLATLKRRLLLIADIVTPSVPEAEVLTGMTIRDLDTLMHAADMLLTLGSKAVLLKGGRFPGERVIDLLVTEEGEEVFENPRIDTVHTHGAGCTLASALATGLAQGLPLRAAVERARRFVFEAIRTAPGLGQGAGPLNHAHALRVDA